MEEISVGHVANIACGFFVYLNVAGGEKLAVGIVDGKEDVREKDGEQGCD